jgi:hypothetical protein
MSEKIIGAVAASAISIALTAGTCAYSTAQTVNTHEEKIKNLEHDKDQTRTDHDKLVTIEGKVNSIDQRVDEIKAQNAKTIDQQQEILDRLPKK